MDIRPWSRFSRSILAVLMGAGTLVGVVLTLVSTYKQKAQSESALILRGEALTRSMARTVLVPMVLDDSAAMGLLAHGFLEEPDVVYADLLGPDGKTLLAKLPSPDFLVPAAVAGLSSVSRQRFTARGRNAWWDITLPIRYSSSDKAHGELLGFARLGLSEARVRQELRGILWSNIGLSLGIMTLAFVLASLLIHRMTRNMHALTEEAQLTAELKRSNKELEAFSYSVSHDLRAPLRSIDAFTQILLAEYRDRLDEKAQGYLARVRTGCQRMAQLIDDLLSLSKVMRQEMSRSPVPLTDIARQTAADLAEANPDRKVGVSIQEGMTIEGDPGLMRIVLENLLGNAWKFTQKRPDARITFTSTRKGRDRVFCIRDNGAGFDMAYANKLFGAFQRLHSGAEFPGTGIGLATVQRIIARHGGQIWAESTLGQGAAFFFQLREGFLTES